MILYVIIRLKNKYLASKRHTKGTTAHWFIFCTDTGLAQSHLLQAKGYWNTLVLPCYVKVSRHGVMQFSIHAHFTSQNPSPQWYIALYGWLTALMSICANLQFWLSLFVLIVHFWTTVWGDYTFRTTIFKSRWSLLCFISLAIIVLVSESTVYHISKDCLAK